MITLEDTVIVSETILGNVTLENELDILEKDLEKIENKCKVDDINKLGVFKNLVNNLHEQIAVLTDDIKFLRNDSNNKSNIITVLLSIINDLQNKVPITNQHSLDNDNTFNDSRYNDHIDNYNNDISNFNRNVDCSGSVMESTVINSIVACNKLTQEITENVKDLSESSLLVTTIADQLRQRHLMSRNSSITNEANTHDVTIQKNMNDNLSQTPLLIPTIEEQLQQYRNEMQDEYMVNKNIYSPISNHVSASNEVSKFTDGEFYEYSARDDFIFGNEVRDTSEIIDYNELNMIYKKPINTDALWKKGTTLIVGDSMLNGIIESKLKNTKVRILPGASIEDMFFHITPLLRKNRLILY